MMCPYSKDTEPELYNAYQQGAADALNTWIQNNPNQPLPYGLKSGTIILYVPTATHHKATTLSYLYVLSVKQG